MKALASNITKTLEPGAELVCADNSGAKKLELIGVKGYKGIRRQRTNAGISDKVTVRVKKGEQEMKKEVHDAVIIRQKKEFQRASGMRVKFEDNAAVIVEGDTNVPKANRIKGVVAKEVVERYSPVGKIASMVV
ncbi:MAG: uL14 family ribosomal protein [Candidatus Nanohaloarchaeota archaeon QJJ-9]|nr:uL14 family ribosomal protein [Candidatus Nanohaloarchaeota archaeon QJJ-9]